MKDELEAELYKRFPKILGELSKPMRGGIAVSDGWYNILVNACWLIQSHIDHTRKNRLRAFAFNRAMKAWLEKGDKTKLEKYFTFGNQINQFNIREIERAIKEGKYKEVPVACSQVIAAQIKEKFGDLRFYYDGGDEYTSAIIDMAEAMSSVTCDACGAPGSKGGSGWISVKCAGCRLGFKHSIEDYEANANTEFSEP